MIHHTLYYFILFYTIYIEYRWIMYDQSVDAVVLYDAFVLNLEDFGEEGLILL